MTATKSGSLLVSFSTSCPLTGPTTFSLSWSCEDSNCSPSASSAGTWEARGPRLLEVHGLPGDTLFSVRVVASLTDCKKGDEEGACVSTSKSELVTTKCGHKCADGTCVQQAIKCNWKAECPDGSDELDCRCTGFNCTSTGFCLPAGQRCDGAVQCSDLSDEQGCGKYKTSNFLHTISCRLSWMCCRSVPLQPDGSLYRRIEALRQTDRLLGWV